VGEGGSRRLTDEETEHLPPLSSKRISRKRDRSNRRVFSIALAVRRRRPLLRYTRDVEVSNPEGVSATNGSLPLAVFENAVPYHASLRREVDLP